MHIRWWPHACTSLFATCVEPRTRVHTHTVYPGAWPTLSAAFLSMCSHQSSAWACVTKWVYHDMYICIYTYTLFMYIRMLHTRVVAHTTQNIPHMKAHHKYVVAMCMHEHLYPRAYIQNMWTFSVYVHAHKHVHTLAHCEQNLTLTIGIITDVICMQVHAHILTCMWKCVSAPRLCICERIHGYMYMCSSMHIDIPTCLYITQHACMQCQYVYVCMYSCARVYNNTYVCLYLNACTHMYSCVYVCIYIYICIHSICT